MTFCKRLEICKRKASLCNLLKIWGQIPEFSNQVVKRSESQYLSYN